MTSSPKWSRPPHWWFTFISGILLLASTVGAESPPSFELKWGTRGSGDGQFSGPVDVAVDSSGNVYVVDSFLNYRIQKFDSSGTFLAKWGTNGGGDGQFSGPADVAADSFNYRIQKFNNSGTFLTKWGAFGSGDGQFNLPYGVAVGSLIYHMAWRLAV